MFFKKNCYKLAISFFIFFVLFLFLKQISFSYEDEIKEEKQKVLSLELKTHSSAINQSIKRRLVLLELLKNHVQVKLNKNGTFDTSSKENLDFIKFLYNSTSGIKVFQVSPSGIHTIVYPLKGNEKTVGRNLFKDTRPNVIAMINQSMKTKKVTLNAPYKLRQGGFGVVSRVAIFNKDKFWGFAVMILDMNKILQEAKFETNGSDMYLAISQNNKIIYGSPDILNKNYVSLDFSVENQDLQLLASRKSSLDEITSYLINMAILIISLLSAILTYILLKRQEKLEVSRDEALEKLEQKNKELNLLIQKAPNPIILHNEEGKVLLVNKVWENLTGYSLEEVETIDKWLEKNKNSSSIKEYFKELIFDEVFEENEFKIKTKEEGNRIWTLKSSILGDIDGKKTFITSAMDITDLKEKDRIMLHQSKMASLGEMLENIAHQWRQPLSVISTASTGVLFSKENGTLEDELLVDSMKAINNSTQYLSQTIDYFREFLTQRADRKENSISEIIEKTIAIVNSKFKNRHIEIIQNVEDISYFCIENELVQILMNLLNNARDALEKVEDQRCIFINVHKKDDNLIIEFKDNAGGISDTIIDKIFEPYFTTKHKKQGTGIGLYMTQEIISKHLSGTIEIKNSKYRFEGEHYKGAMFTITLPLNN